MTEHTPGPWRMTYNPLRGDRYYIRPKGSNANIAVILPSSAVIKTAGEMEKNGLLIAAAPDMLEALKAIATTAAIGNRSNDNYKFKTVFDIASKAISKATT